LLLTTGDYNFRLHYAGSERSYIIHVPPQAALQQPLPAILNFHGGGGNAKGYMQYTKMNEYSDQQGFFVVYPNGTGERADKFLSWNAGSCCGYAFDNQIDDVGFINALLEELPVIINVDKRRIYATGISNGAMMVYRLASELCEKIAAFAAVAGGAFIDDIKSTGAVAILHIHSVDDARALYLGGEGPRFPLTNRRVNHPNIENMLKKWITHNQCEVQPEIDKTIYYEHIANTCRTNESDIRKHSICKHSATKYTYRQSQGKNIVMWKLTGAGHVWPGGLAYYLEGLLGESTKVIDANREIWNYFSSYSLTDS